MAYIICALVIYFSLRPVHSSTSMSVLAVLAAPNLTNRGLHSVLRDFICINYAPTLVSDLLSILELI